MNEAARELIEFVQKQSPESFQITHSLQPNRFLPRQFPAPLPLSLHYQDYPEHSRMVGDNWLHWHDYYELFVAIGGGGTFSHGDDRYPFEPGDILLADPLKLHGVHQMQSSYTALVIVFPAIAVRAASVSLEKRYLSAWDDRPKNRCGIVSAIDPKATPLQQSIQALARTWFSRCTSTASLGNMHRQLLSLLDTLGQILGTDLSQKVQNDQKKSLREQRLRNVLDYIARNAGNSLQQSDVASIAGMSISRFRVFFKETTGWRYDHYLRDVRLENAARLLRSSDHSIAEIASNTGFSDQSHLQRSFKARFSTSPLEYRKKHRSKTSELFKK